MSDRPKSDLVTALEEAHARDVAANLAVVDALSYVELILQLDALARDTREFSPAFIQALAARAAGELRRAFL